MDRQRTVVEPSFDFFVSKYFIIYYCVIALIYTAVSEGQIQKHMEVAAYWLGWPACDQDKVRFLACLLTIISVELHLLGLMTTIFHQMRMSVIFGVLFTLYSATIISMGQPDRQHLAIMIIWLILFYNILNFTCQLCYARSLISRRDLRLSNVAPISVIGCKDTVRVSAV